MYAEIFCKSSDCNRRAATKWEMKNAETPTVTSHKAGLQIPHTSHQH